MEKKTKFGIFLITLGLVMGSPVLSSSAEAKSTEYDMVWSDEFSGTTLNADNWSYNIGNGNAGWGNREHEYYTDREDNVKVENGNLIITAKAEEIKHPTSGTVFHYTSGRINSSGLQSFKYGRLEARMRIPKSKGMWPAFWMLGYNKRGWPYCGEIDIMETWNWNNFVQGAIHWENELERPGRDTYRATHVQMEDKGDWHLYGIDWTPEKVEWTLDGKVFKTFEITSEERDELRAPFYFIINCAVGGNLAYYTPDEDFVSDTLVIDYVRVYQRECDEGTYEGKWTEEEKAKVPMHTLQLKLGAGDGSIKYEKLREGENTTIPTLEKSKYHFLGWYDGTLKVDSNTRIYSDVTAYPKWQKIKVQRANVKVVRKKKTVTLKCSVKQEVDGYEVKVGSKKRTSLSDTVKLGKLKSGKAYQAKVRAYITDSTGKKVFGKWSKIKKITIG